MAFLKFEDIDKSFGENNVISKFNLEVEEGKFIVLLGPSGCGKSTLLRMIAGLEKIDNGKILLENNLLNDLLPSKRQIAMVFQSYALYPHMNVFQNISFGLKSEKISKNDIKDKVIEAAKILKIEELLDRRPKELSGGQRQRVAIGRAITRNPKLFLFDEPLSNLDAALRAEMRVEISKLHKKLKSNIVYVTHDQIEAMTMADKIVVMQDGYIEQIGTPLELYDRPSNVFVAGFIGSPAMNLIPGTTKKSGKSFAAEIYGGKLPLPKINSLADGQEVLIGVRPEQLIPGKTGIAATVSVVEPTGSETHLIVRSGEQDLISVIRDRSSFSVGEKINLSAEKSFLHVFDAKTSERLNDD